MAQTEQLLSEFKSGNIGTFYNELYAKLLVYASRHLGPDYAFLAEDCVQDAVYKAYEQRGSFKSVLTLKAFLYSCIHHAAIDILRKNQAQSNYLSQQDDRTEFLNSIIEQETLNLLYDSIERLPEKYRDKIEMKKIRFRTLGCWPLTGAIESEADTIEKIVEEMMTTTKSERTTRVIDFDQEASMEQKKREGYF